MAEYQQKDNTGNVFDNKYKETKSHPDMTGTIVIGKDLLKELVEKAKEGKPAKLAVSVWKNTGKSGKPYQSVSLKLFKEYKKDSEVPF